MSQLVKKIDDLTKTITSTEGKALMAKLLDKRTEYIKSQNVVIALIEKNKKDDVNKELFGSVRKSQGEYFAAVDEIISFQGKLMDSAEDKVEALVKVTRDLSIILCK